MFNTSCTRNMKNAISTDQIKAIDLCMLIEIDKICRNEGIRYSLAYGSLLGAVRHKGFIPWDDDIDLFMPRPDYNRFIEYCRSHKTEFGFVSCEINPHYHRLYGKAWDIKTTIEDPFSNYTGIDLGVNIDIMPIDGIGHTYEEAKENIKPAIYFNKVISAMSWDRYRKSITNPWYVEPVRFGLFVITRFLNKDKYTAKLNRIVQKYNFEEMEYVAAVCDTKTFKAIKDKKIYSEYVELEFEGHKFWAMAGYDTFLREIYGDYMKLPPENKRVSNHNVIAYYK